jgi:hypothetical protein
MYETRNIYSLCGLDDVDFRGFTNSQASFGTIVDWKRLTKILLLLLLNRLDGASFSFTWKLSILDSTSVT